MKGPDPEEIFPLVDEEGNTIGEASRSLCHNGKSFLLHPVVHLHVFNSRGELYLQKRSLTKDIQPGKWDTSVGGHMSPGENVTEALAREAREELGIESFTPEFLGKYVWKSSREKELINSFSIIYNKVPVIDPSEIDEGRFWSVHEISKNIGTGIFTPNFEHEFNLLLKNSVNKLTDEQPG